MKLCMYIKLSVKYICSSLQNLHFSQQKKDVYAKENMGYSSITFIIHEHTGLQGCDLESVDTVYRWLYCK